jgi:hypothetical protein
MKAPAYGVFRWRADNHYHVPEATALYVNALAAQHKADKLNKVGGQGMTISEAPASIRGGRYPPSRVPRRLWRPRLPCRRTASFLWPPRRCDGAAFGGQVIDKPKRHIAPVYRQRPSWERRQVEDTDDLSAVGVFLFAMCLLGLAAAFYIIMREILS